MKPDREHSLYLPFGTALRDKLRGGYNLSKLREDLLAGITVGIVAVPLSMALAIGSGVPPQYGLYTAIVAGLLIALTGGSRYSVSGPTAAFIVILHPIAEKYGLGGLVTASCMATFPPRECPTTDAWEMPLSFMNSITSAVMQS